MGLQALQGEQQCSKSPCSPPSCIHLADHCFQDPGSRPLCTRCTSTLSHASAMAASCDTTQQHTSRSNACQQQSMASSSCQQVCWQLLLGAGGAKACNCVRCRLLQIPAAHLLSVSSHEGASRAERRKGAKLQDSSPQLVLIWTPQVPRATPRHRWRHMSKELPDQRLNKLPGHANDLLRSSAWLLLPSGRLTVLSIPQHTSN